MKLISDNDEGFSSENSSCTSSEIEEENVLFEFCENFKNHTSLNHKLLLQMKRKNHCKFLATMDGTSPNIFAVCSCILACIQYCTYLHYLEHKHCHCCSHIRFSCSCYCILCCNLEKHRLPNHHR